MGANVTIECPVEGCGYRAGFRLGMGEETSSAAWAERQAILLEEHPDHGGDTPAVPSGKTITDL